MKVFISFIHSFIINTALPLACLVIARCGTFAESSAEGLPLAHLPPPQGLTRGVTIARVALNP